MRQSEHIFHLAIPCASLSHSKDFYVRLGCRIGREMDDRITIDFFGDQIVCHLAPEEIDSSPRLYPRHFGVTFRNREDLDAIIERAESENLRRFAELSTRFAGRRDEHLTFCLIDPSNNILEFKWYADASMMY